MNIVANIQNLDKRISVICKKANIDSKDIKIIAASKYATVDQIKEAYAAGISVFGENKVQDLLYKQQELLQLPIEWHFIGHLQTNKVKKIIGHVQLIHSIDSLKVATEINKRAVHLNIKQSVLIQVNVSSEEGKGGFKLSESLQKAWEIGKLEAIELKGLMTIAPLTQEEKVLRRHFYQSKQIFDSIETEIGPGFKILSMGMSNDFELALEYGANLLRLGSIIWRNDE